MNIAMPNRKTPPMYIAMVWSVVRKNGKESNAQTIYNGLRKVKVFPILSENNVLEILNNMVHDGFLEIKTKSRKPIQYTIPSRKHLERTVTSNYRVVFRLLLQSH